MEVLPAPRGQHSASATVSFSNWAPLPLPTRQADAFASQGDGRQQSSVSETVPVIFRNIITEKPSMNIVNCKCQLGSFKGHIHVLSSAMNSK